MASRSRTGSICEQPGNFLYGEICSGKGVRNNREFVIPVFIICVNPYNRKDREKICTSEIVSLYPSIHCIHVRCKRVALYVLIKLSLLQLNKG